MMSKTVTFLQRCSFGQMVSFHALWSFPFYQHVTFIPVLLLVHVKKNSPLSSNFFIVIEATVVLESTEQYLLCRTNSCWLDVLAVTFLISENTLGLY
ncbi:hypothetical protein AAC387_Pa03g2209 [Persea americana]